MSHGTSLFASLFHGSVTISFTGMKTKLVLWLALVSATLSLIGCASAPPNTPAKSTSSSTPPPARQGTLQAAPVAKPEAKGLLPASAATPPAPFEGEGWESLFAGQTLTGWHVTEFAGHGEVQLQSGVIILNMGDPFTGINYTNSFPKMNYELALDAMRLMGSDFFCGLTVPVGESFCSLIVGGWGGSLVGISSFDGMDASENETTKFMNFEKGRWYRIRLRVTEARIEVWIDDTKMANVVTTDKKIALRPGDIDMSKPMGLAAWQTSAALRAIKVREVSGPADRSKAAP
jgi:hypothetical protein